MAVHRSTCVPFGEVDHLGVVIREFRPADRAPFRHAGFLYRIDDGAPLMVHLAWHYCLRHEPPDEDYLWQTVALEEENRQVVAAWLGAEHLHPADIPYGFDAFGLCFDENDEFVPPPVGKGLTCATLISAVLAFLGFELLEQNTWEDRPDDVHWQNEILRALRGHASPAHIEALQTDIGAKRFRPEEVVGAAITSDPKWPVPFSDARQMADSILRDLADAVGAVQRPA